jgi:hypothetical protein
MVLDNGPQAREREMLSWSKAVLKALETGAEVREETSSGVVVGLRINGRVIRPRDGWYTEAEVEEAARA